MPPRKNEPAPIFKGSAGDTVAFQGDFGAYSHLSCKSYFPDLEAVSCSSFEEALAMVTTARSTYAMIPIENSVAGRVADIHQLLPDHSLHITGEHFQRIHHQLLCIEDSSMDRLKTVRSHIQALGQCRKNLKSWGLAEDAFNDTAGAAKSLKQLNDPTVGAIASSLAGEIYGLKTIQKDIEDENHNTTRFVIFSKEEILSDPALPSITSFLFQVKNISGALYKVMGSFATNGINMIKLESYQLGGAFAATQFYVEVEGHQKSQAVIKAFDEMKFFTKKFRCLGSYPQADYRKSR